MTILKTVIEVPCRNDRGTCRPDVPNVKGINRRTIEHDPVNHVFITEIWGTTDLRDVKDTSELASPGKIDAVKRSGKVIREITNHPELGKTSVRQVRKDRTEVIG